MMTWNQFNQLDNKNKYKTYNYNSISFKNNKNKFVN